jgi:hypothetical protein
MLSLSKKHSAGILAVGMLVAGCSTALGQGPTQCRPPDVESTRLLSYVRKLVTTVDPERVALRTSLGLTAMDSLQVTLVTAKQVCAKAVQGMNQALKTGNLPRLVHVVTVGTDFAVRDPDAPAGEYLPTMFLDKKFKYKSSVLGSVSPFSDY